MEFIPAMKEECGESHFDDYNFSSNPIDKININGKSKCGEIYILENDLFSFLCTLCDSPFEEIENLFVHVKGKHSAATRKNDCVEEKHNEYMDSDDDNFLYKDVKVEIHGQDTSNDEIKSTIQQEDGQMSTTSLNIPSEMLKMKIRSVLDNDCQDDNDEDNTVLSDLFKISKSTFKKQGVKRKPNKSNVKSKNNKEKRKPEIKDKPVCDICNKTFASRKGVRRHKIYRHTSFVNIPESLKCSFCNRHFEDSSKRADHERVHTGERPYQCQVCGKCFRTKAVCMNHEISHSNVRQFKCEICNLAFKNRSDLYMHTQRHGEKKFKCTYCEKSFFKNSERSRHERSHTDLKPFKCTFCEKSFKSSSSLKIHSRTHTGIRPYQCEYCDKSFGTKAILDNHIVVHTGERPFVCNICNATFPRKKALKSHEKIHSDARAYVCKICGEAFKLYQGLYSHMHKHGKSIVKNKTNE